MTTRFRHTIRGITLFGLYASLTSCIYDYPGPCDEPSIGWFPTNVEAEYDTEWYIPITPRINWDKDFPTTLGVDRAILRPQIPSGLRIVSYPDEGEIRTFNLPAHGGEINLHSLSSHLLFYNNDTEYIIINPQAGFDNVTATTRQNSSSTYKGNSAVGTVETPQPIYSAPDMLFRAAIEDYDAETEDSLRVINIQLVPAVYTYVIHFAFDAGTEYIQKATGAVTGMSKGVFLNNGKPIPSEMVTVLYECQPEDDGYTGIVKTFGLPDYDDEGKPLYPDRRYGITLQAYLRNGKLLIFDFDISSQMQVQPEGGIIMVSGLSISDIDGKPDGGNGAFDVDVNPWGPSDDIDIM